MSSCEDFLRAIETSLDDILAGRASEVMAAHLASCASCRLAVEEQRAVRDVLASRGEDPPPAGARERLAARLDALDDDRSTPPAVSPAARQPADD